MTLAEVGKKIKIARVSKDMSQSELGKRIGVTGSAIGFYENGKREFDRKTRKALANALGLAEWELDFEETEIGQNTKKIPGAETYDYSTPRAMVPIVGSVQCGPGGLAYQDLQGAEMADVGNPAEYFYLRAIGDSMEPKICAGDLVLIHQQEEVENGDLAVVIIDGEEGMLKKFTRENGAVILQSFNPAYPPRVIIGDAQKSIRIVGKAVRQVRTW